MSIRSDIEKNYQQSIRDKKSDITNTLRLIKSAIKDKDIVARSTGNNNGISDQEILGLLQNLVKQRKDSIESFKTANRQDLIENEEAEIEIIKIYLPEQKNEEEISLIIEDLIRSNNLSSIKDMGKLMGIMKNKYSGEIDMGLVGKVAKLKLGD
ncbi:MAG: hypothetical protein CFH15_00815 [Alphaproteobacteria bacterium MarineAlpha5_Bin5]|nr:MAG: hypothetical protein CFH14_01119 [Alphaproteobacteria bacterium MarineAlpha5_Bin4]PPR49954.1 MAG: hypothetical protein CFH15_00815 [Alphaproteobacteria bacterium MarineAlpha5_Bin5]|tara:strand:- start:1800 stop:2261 length:462 start_codon:yes stop_codon:yes gene_type:complete